MKTRILGIVLVLALLATLCGAAQAFGQTVPPNTGKVPSSTYTFPLLSNEVTGQTSEPQAVASAGLRRSQAGQAIIIDHTTTDISKIPDYWIEQAKKVAVHYAHTSHGSQVLSGLDWLEGQNSKYNVAIRANGTVTLPADASALRIYDGNNYPGDTYIVPEMYWASADGVTHTQSVVNTGWFTYSTWTWCGQQSSNTTSTVQLYLNTLHGLEQQYPNMRFIYMTGHTDGGSATLARNNDIVRQYVRDNDKVLFDFADIETYDPLGDGPYVNNSEGTCAWCASFCTAHPEYCASLPGSCAHTDSPSQAKLFCKLKGQAWWWLMARLAGWPGPDASSPLTIDKSVALTHNPAWPGDPITYTIVVRNASVTDTTGVRITDTLPTYVVGTDLDTTRAVAGHSAVTITLPATVAGNVPSGATIVNTAFFTHTSGGGSDSASLAVSTLLPDFSASAKRVNATTIQAGGLVTFTIALSNTGLAAATVRYTDTLPVQLDRVSGALTGTASVGSGSMSAPMVIVARAKRNLADGTAFNNTVAINDGVHAVFNIASPNVTVLSPDLSASIRTVNKSIFEPGEYITYTLTLVNSGGMNATARYTLTLPAEVTWTSGALSGTQQINAGASSSPLVVAAQLKAGLAGGTTFHAYVDLNDGYHPVSTLNFPETAIHAFYTYLPLVVRNYSPSSGRAIIIDHTNTDISKIPDYWLTKAKELTLHFAHTSHGSQLLAGADWWEAQDSKYNVAIRENDTVELPSEADALRIYDGNNVPGTTYITPDLYWSESGGIDYTRSVADTGWFGFSMWSWCGQQSDNSVETVQQYLDTLNQLETQYSAMRFIYMTGHTDGTGEGGTLYRNNDLVRQYVRDHGKVLFDFADIETYDPAGGGPYVNNSEGTCQWCAAWCQNHPEYCASLPDSCAHTDYEPEQTLFCKLKGQAFWWMMARLAGWDGVTQ